MSDSKGRLEDLVHSLQSELSCIYDAMRRAEEVQIYLMEKDIKIDGIHISSHYRQAKFVGGDLYTFHAFDDCTLGVLIADVTGHGWGAGLVSTFMAGSFPHITTRNPVETLVALQSCLPPYDYRKFARTATAAYGVIDRKEMTFTYATAGHPPIAHLKKSGEVSYLVLSGSTPLNLPESVRNNQTINIEVGDRLIFYTDGCYAAFCGDEPAEASICQKVFYEELEKCQTRPGGFMRLTDKIRNYTREHKNHSDDMAFVVLEIEESGE